jgi:para-nitrobenzyl esterase
MPALQETKWDGVRDTFEFGPAAPQLKTREHISEDCLYLNVWTPGLRDGAKRKLYARVPFIQRGTF